MKKIVFLVLAFSLIANSAYGTCDWSTVKANPDGTYTYSKELNICVGQLVQSSAVKDQQIADYKKALTLKDLAINTSEQRIQAWSDTSMRLEKNIQEIDSVKKNEQWLYFALGAATVFAAGMAAASLTNRH